MDRQARHADGIYVNKIAADVSQSHNVAQILRVNDDAEGDMQHDMQGVVGMPRAPALQG